jgi:hypothetical protein
MLRHVEPRNEQLIAIGNQRWQRGGLGYGMPLGGRIGTSSRRRSVEP